jgi:hypothetical protein
MTKEFDEGRKPDEHIDDARYACHLAAEKHANIPLKKTYE